MPRSSGIIDLGADPGARSDEGVDIMELNELFTLLLLLSPGLLLSILVMAIFAVGG
jgi:hypothetical protein